jgi:uncharacterized membrane protein
MSTSDLKPASAHRRSIPFACAFAGSLTVLVALMLLKPAAAQASLSVCNQTSSTLLVAIGFTTLIKKPSSDPNVVISAQIVDVTEGWWRTLPGKCVTPMSYAMDPDKGIMIYAERVDQPGTNVLGPGDQAMCVDTTKAFQKIVPMNGACPAGTVARRFTARQTPSADYTETIR